MRDCRTVTDAYPTIGKQVESRTADHVRMELSDLSQNHQRRSRLAYDFVRNGSSFQEFGIFPQQGIQVGHTAFVESSDFSVGND